jgi:hypothetical protein
MLPYSIWQMPTYTPSSAVPACCSPAPGFLPLSSTSADTYKQEVPLCLSGPGKDTCRQYILWQQLGYTQAVTARTCNGWDGLLTFHILVPEKKLPQACLTYHY